MTFARRHLLLTAAAAGLTAAAPKPKGAMHKGPGPLAAPPGDAAINRYFDGLSEHILATGPEQATSLGLDTGARAALKSRLGDASMTHVAEDRAWCRAGLAKLETFPDAGLSPAA